MTSLKIRGSSNKHDPYFVDTYQQIPVYSYFGEKLLEDDLDDGGCPYTSSYDYYHWSDNATFSEAADFIFPVIKEPVGRIFGLS